METYLYKCDTCGYVYIVPAYGAAHAPEVTRQQPHIELKTLKPCVNQRLMLIEEDNRRNQAVTSQKGVVTLRGKR